jgi:receptor protein-tyrosine kinase
MLNDVGATLLGAVLTMMPTRGSGAYSYNYYYYGGSYGDDKPDRSIDSSTAAGNVTELEHGSAAETKSGAPRAE